MLDTVGLVLGDFDAVSLRKLLVDPGSAISFLACKSEYNVAMDPCWFCLLWINMILL